MTKANLFLNLFGDKEAKSFAAGQFAFKAGDPRDAMYVITEGEVELIHGSAIFETAGPGSIVGEMALINAGPHSSTVVAKTDCQLVAVDRSQFEFMVQETPFFALAVMKVLAGRLLKAIEKSPAK